MKPLIGQRWKWIHPECSHIIEVIGYNYFNSHHCIGKIVQIFHQKDYMKLYVGKVSPNYMKYMPGDEGQWLLLENQNVSKL